MAAMTASVLAGLGGVKTPPAPPVEAPVEAGGDEMRAMTSSVLAGGLGVGGSQGGPRRRRS